MLGRNLRLLLLHHERIVMSELAALYRENYGVDLSPALYGFQTLYQVWFLFVYIFSFFSSFFTDLIVLSLQVLAMTVIGRVDVGNIISRSDSKLINSLVNL